jgi:hypothetical protein
MAAARASVRHTLSTPHIMVHVDTDREALQELEGLTVHVDENGSVLDAPDLGLILSGSAIQLVCVTCPDGLTLSPSVGRAIADVCNASLSLVEPDSEVKAVYSQSLHDEILKLLRKARAAPPAA